MPKLKLKNSLAKVNYVKTLVIKGTCEVKEIVDYVDHRLNHLFSVLTSDNTSNIVSNRLIQ